MGVPELWQTPKPPNGITGSEFQGDRCEGRDCWTGAPRRGEAELTAEPVETERR